MNLVSELDLPDVRLLGSRLLGRPLPPAARRDPPARLAGQVATRLHRARPRRRGVLPAVEEDRVPRPPDRRVLRRDQRPAGRAHRRQHPEPQRGTAPAAAGPGRAGAHAPRGGSLAPGDARLPGAAVGAGRRPRRVRLRGRGGAALPVADDRDRARGAAPGRGAAARLVQLGAAAVRHPGARDQPGRHRAGGHRGRGLRHRAARGQARGSGRRPDQRRCWRPATRATGCPPPSASSW